MNLNELINTTPIEQFIDRIGVNKIFGTPTTQGDTTIIPVAQVEFGFGFGGGYGAGNSIQSSGEEGVNEAANLDKGGEGGGTGGGAGGRSTPRGYIHIGPEEVKYTPIMDETRIPLAGIFMIIWSVFWTMLTIRAIAKAIVNSREKVLLTQGKEA